MLVMLFLLLETTTLGYLSAAAVYEPFHFYNGWLMYDLNPVDVGCF